MTLLEAQALKAGDHIHSITRTNADGTPMRAKLTSVKLWKTRPDHVLLKYKRGMYEYGSIDQTELDDFQPGYGS